MVIQYNGSKLKLMEEFRYEYSQTQPGVTILTTATKWATFWARFGIDKNEETCITWQNKG